MLNFNINKSQTQSSSSKVFFIDKIDVKLYVFYRKKTLKQKSSCTRIVLVFSEKFY